MVKKRLKKLEKRLKKLEKRLEDDYSNSYIFNLNGIKTAIKEDRQNNPHRPRGFRIW